MEPDISFEVSWSASDGGCSARVEGRVDPGTASHASPKFKAEFWTGTNDRSPRAAKLYFRSYTEVKQVQIDPDIRAGTSCKTPFAKTGAEGLPGELKLNAQVRVRGAPFAKGN